MNRPHIFTLDQVQSSVKCNSFEHGRWIYWDVNDCIVAFDSSAGYVYVWGLDASDRFSVVDEELYRQSTENILPGQGPLELLVLHLENPQKRSLDYQLERLQ